MFASTTVHLGGIVGDQLRVSSHETNGDVFVMLALVDAAVCLSGPPEELAALFGRLAEDVERHRQPPNETHQDHGSAPAPMTAARGVARTYQGGPDNAQPTRPQP